MLLKIRTVNIGYHPERRAILERLARLMERDELTAVVAGEYDVDEIARAHRDVLEGGYVGKLIVTVS